MATPTFSVGQGRVGQLRLAPRRGSACGPALEDANRVFFGIEGCLESGRAFSLAGRGRCPVSRVSTLLDAPELA